MGITLITWIVTGWRRSFWSALMLLVAVVSASSKAHAQDTSQTTAVRLAAASPSAAQKQKLMSNYLHTPLQFEPNQGQTDKQVQFVSQGAGYSLFLTSNKAVLSLSSPAGKQAALEMVVAGANPLAVADGIEPFAARSNYIRGNDPNKWRTNVPEYGRVRYQQLYPGIDLTFYGNQRRVEYDFVVAPGANPNTIRLQFHGMDHMRLDRSGELRLQTAAGEVHLDRPVIYQENADGSHAPVQGSFAIAKNEIIFKVGDYDKARPLVIDPVVQFATFLGGSNNENNFADGKSGSYLSAIAIGPDQSIYVTGITSSSDFPTTTGAYQSTYTSGNTMFVTKFNPSGTGVAYSTYLGGTGGDTPDGIAIDSLGFAYIAGSTQSSNFPVTAGAIQSARLSSNTGFVTKLSQAGNSLIFSTYLGGTFVTELTGIAVDLAGHVYVTGLDNKGFPTTTGAFQTTVPGQENVVVAELQNDGKSLLYATYIGGEKVDIPRGIVIDSTGNAYIGGYTTSTAFPIVPTSGALQKTIGNTDGTPDGFVVKLNPTGTGLVYSTYLGGSALDQVNAIAVDSSGSAYVAGQTSSTNFPVVAPLQSANATNGDAFVAKLSPAGTSLAYSTYLGGKGEDFATGIVVDQAGDAFVGGITSSTAGAAGTFPTLYPIPLPDPGQLVTAAFVTEYNPTGSAMIYSTFFGGEETVEASSIAIDSIGDIFITGVVVPPAAFATPGAPQQTLKGNSDAFVAELYPMQVSPTALAFPNTPVGTTSAPLTVTIAYTGTGGLFVQTDPTGSESAFSQKLICGGFVAPQSSCTINVTFTPTAPGPFTGSFSFTTNASPVPQVITLSGTGTGTGTPQAVLTPAAINFGSQAVGTTSNVQVATLSNPGTAVLSISNVFLTGTNPTFFAINNGCGATLAIGASCNISVTFTPPSANPFSAALTIADNAVSLNQSTSLTGTGGGPQITQTNSVVFGNQAVGTTSATQNITLSNSGNANLTISSIALSGANPNLFTLNSASCPATLAPAASCTMTVSFSATSQGSFSAGVTVTPGNAGIAAGFTQLTGTGVVQTTPQAVLTPSTIAFGNQTSGTTSASQSLTLSNPGNGALSITSITLTGTNTAAFTLTNGCGSTLAAGATCNLSVTFTPSSATTFSAGISVVDNAAGSPQIATLSGTGTTPPDFTTASPTPPQTVSRGSVATYQINVTSATGTFNQPVTLSATGLPLGATVTFTPATVTPGSAGATSTMAIQTSPTAVLFGIGGPLSPGPAGIIELASSALVMASCCFYRKKLRLQNGRRLILLVGGLILLSLGVTACGGGFPEGKKSATFVITVTGANGTDLHATTVTLTVD
jgi:Beta-propeller repeat/Abnormal spindle-like microcephaly-assoc'd, ASPM-SPD-2-Hydin